MPKAEIPYAALSRYLRGYQAELLREHSNARRYVFFSRPLQKYIVVRKRGDTAELEFLNECPCADY